MPEQVSDTNQIVDEQIDSILDSLLTDYSDMGYDKMTRSEAKKQLVRLIATQVRLAREEDANLAVKLLERVGDGRTSVSAASLLIKTRLAALASQKEES